MSFGHVISEARKKTGLSQKELALKIKKEDGKPISPQYLNDIEHDRRSPSSDHLIRQFSEALDIPIEILYYRVGQIPEDVRGEDVNRDRVVRAYKAFRRTLKGK